MSENGKIAYFIFGPAVVVFLILVGARSYGDVVEAKYDAIARCISAGHTPAECTAAME